MCIHKYKSYIYYFMLVFDKFYAFLYLKKFTCIPTSSLFKLQLQMSRSVVAELSSFVIFTFFTAPHGPSCRLPFKLAKLLFNLFFFSRSIHSARLCAFFIHACSKLTTVFIKKQRTIRHVLFQLRGRELCVMLCGGIYK